MRERKPKGLAKFLILEMMSEKPRYGYGILGELKEISGGYWEPSYGTVYGTLETLEEEGYIQRSEEDHEERKYFTLTEDGREYLEELRAKDQKLKDKFRKMMLGIFNVYKHICGGEETGALLEDIQEEFRSD